MILAEIKKGNQPGPPAHIAIIAMIVPRTNFSILAAGCDGEIDPPEGAIADIMLQSPIY